MLFPLKMALFIREIALIDENLITNSLIRKAHLRAIKLTTHRKKPLKLTDWKTRLYLRTIWLGRVRCLGTSTTGNAPTLTTPPTFLRTRPVLTWRTKCLAPTPMATFTCGTTRESFGV